jgi:hypothetical protein
VSVTFIQPVAWCAAFWTALALFTRRARPARTPRFVAALVLGAASAHGGWLLLHAPTVWPALRARPGLLVDAGFGVSVLFVPLGPLLLERSVAAFASLPLALAVARLGCLAGGCCLGRPTQVPWAVGGLHPAALYEVAGLVVVHMAISHAAPRRSAPLALGGIAAVRLIVDPFRAEAPLGAPIVPPSVIAALWLLVALAMALARSREVTPAPTRHSMRRRMRQHCRDGRVPGSSRTDRILISPRHRTHTLNSERRR